MSGGLALDDVIAAAEFRAVLRSFMRQSERIARASGLTPQRYLLLLMVKGAPDRSEQARPIELARRLQISTSSVSELIARAEEIGLVECHDAGYDGRVSLIRLTPEGERRLALSFTALETERRQFRDAIGLDPPPPGHEAEYAVDRPATGRGRSRPGAVQDHENERRSLDPAAWFGRGQVAGST